MAFLKLGGSIDLNVKEIRKCPQIGFLKKLCIGAICHVGICNCQCVLKLAHDYKNLGLVPFSKIHNSQGVLKKFPLASNIC